MRTAELICTGSELLNGSILNTHAQTTGARLREVGVVLQRTISLPDDPATITAAVREAMSRTDILLVTGGLGPTRDDLTRESVAKALGKPLVPDAGYLTKLEEHYAKRNRRMTDDRRRMADKVEGSELLPNPRGSAPGHDIQDAETSTRLFVLPGPPREFNPMLADTVLPLLAGEAAPPTARLMIAGLGESEVERLLRKRKIDPAPAELAFCANPLGLELRLTAPNADALGPVVETFRELLGEHLYAEPADGRVLLPAFATERLIESGRTLAIAESCTGGLLGQLITDTPGISSAFLGGVVAYANEAKEELLGVPNFLLREHGAVSDPVARAMATGVRSRLGSDIALSITGIAGPGGGTEEKPVGLIFIGVATERQTVAHQYILPGDRDFVRILAAARALDLLRLELSHVPNVGGTG